MFRVNFANFFSVFKSFVLRENRKKALRKLGSAAFTSTPFLSTADCVISEKEGFVQSRLTDAFSSLLDSGEFPRPPHDKCSLPLLCERLARQTQHNSHKVALVSCDL